MKLMTYDTLLDGEHVRESSVFLDNGITPEEVMKKWNANTNNWKYVIRSVYDIQGKVHMEQGDHFVRVIYSRQDI